MKQGLRVALGGLLAFCALNAFGGGIYGLMGARAVPREWLAGTPFRDFFVPSVILLVVVGGAFAVGAVAAFARWPRAWRFSALAGAIVIGWIAVQVAMIGFVSWLQPFMACAGLVLLAAAAGGGDLTSDPVRYYTCRNQLRRWRTTRGIRIPRRHRGRVPAAEGALVARARHGRAGA